MSFPICFTFLLPDSDSKQSTFFSRHIYLLDMIHPSMRLEVRNQASMVGLYQLRLSVRIWTLPHQFVTRRLTSILLMHTYAYLSDLTRFKYLLSWNNDSVNRVPYDHSMARAHVADEEAASHIWRQCANIFKKQCRAADKEWSTSSGVRRTTPKQRGTSML
jgi:hypothetical protein